MKKPQFKPHFQVEIVQPNTVYLLSEESSIALTGNLYCQLAPLLDGNHTISEIIAQLKGKVDFNSIYYAINKLKTKNYLTENFNQQPRHVSAFWSSLNLNPEIAFQRLQQASVSITAYGDVPTQSLITTLKSLGVQVQDSATSSSSKTSLAVVLTDDYLRPNLEKFNQDAIAAGIPWILVKPVGTKLWLGPIFDPGKTGCWQCLAQRLQSNQEVVSTIQQQNEHKFISTAQALLPSTLQTGINLAATEILKWIVKDQEKPDHSIATLAGKVITLNLANLDLQTHILTKRPQCSACGDQSYGDRQPQKITLTSLKKQFTIDGGHRVLSPEQTLDRWQHHLSPITGVVSALIRTSEPGSNHSYLAVHNFGQATDLHSLRHNLHNKAAGKGRTESQAKASGFCEAIERYSGLFQGDEIRTSTTYTQLNNSAIHPASCLQFSQNQYQNRELLNQNYLGVDFIPEPFTEDQETQWTPVWSLTEQTFKYMSTALCYYKYPPTGDRPFGFAHSNGNAAGNVLEEAILQGFMELVERDSVAIWWYNRLQRPAVDLESFQDPYLAELSAYYQERGREFWVLDLTVDLGIPVFAAISRCIQGKEIIVAGYGAHLDPNIALMRAVTEMNQFLSRVEIQYPDRLEAGLDQWLTNADLENQPYLAPDIQATPKVYSDYPQCWSDDLRQDILNCVAIAKSQNLETLVLDQTRPDIGLNVVKVIVPGLRHFLPRLAPGRLYDVPVKMGWLTASLAEEQMNPMPMPF
jgi:oxazoline/thiazoline synthase